MTDGDLERRAPVLAIVHRVMVNGEPKKGGIDIILEDLLAAGHPVLLVELQLAGKLGFSRAPGLDSRGFCHVKRLAGGEETRLGSVVFPRMPEMARWAYEALRVPSILNRFAPRPLPDLALTTDPLCCLAAWHLVRRGDIRRYHFHCVDYSDRRFGVAWLDALYRLLYRHAARRAASVDVVSRPMERVVAGFLGGAPDKLFWMPNTPACREYPFVPPSERRPHALACTVAGVEPVYRVEALIDAIDGLRAEFQDCELVIVGNTEVNPAYTARLRDEVRRRGLSDRVRWEGFLPRAAARDRVARCSVGMALYDAGVPHIRYIDSLKIREYAAAGLPCVGSRVCATAVEAEEAGAGFAVDGTREAVERVRSLWKDPELYGRTVEASRRWAERMDKETLMRGFRARVGLLA